MVSSHRQKTRRAVQKKITTKRSDPVVLHRRISLMILGLALVLISFIPDLAGQLTKSQTVKVQAVTAQNNESTSFSSEPVKVDNRLKTATNKKQFFPPTRILIPSLVIDLPVKEAKVIDGYWEVFSDSAGFGMGSGLPGEVNNQVIFAHARAGLFLHLRDIAMSERIYVLTKANWFTYTVSDIREVKPEQTEVIAPSKEEILTLYTCSGFADSKRLIVVAKRSP